MEASPAARRACIRLEARFALSDRVDETRRSSSWSNKAMPPAAAEAQAAIRAGLVRVDGAVARQAVAQPSPTARRSNIDKPHPFVSRGGVKLAAALDHFELSPEGRICLDIGASTGGFTEVLLAARRGAGLCHRCRAWPVASEPARAIRAWCVRDGVNARDLTAAHVPEAPERHHRRCQLHQPETGAAAGAGAGGAGRLAGGAGQAAIRGRARLDRQGRHRARRRGARRGAGRHRRIGSAAQTGWTVLGTMESPIQGGDGNNEFLLAAQKT